MPIAESSQFQFQELSSDEGGNARWLASRIESRSRRALRDYQRAELRSIHASDRRARGLRLYAAWSCKENKAMNYRTVVPLHPSSQKIAA
jgi:hypothetical protein